MFGVWSCIETCWAMLSSKPCSRPEDDDSDSVSLPPSVHGSDVEPSVQATQHELRPLPNDIDDAVDDDDHLVLPHDVVDGDGEINGLDECIDITDLHFESLDYCRLHNNERIHSITSDMQQLLADIKPVQHIAEFYSVPRLLPAAQ